MLENVPATVLILKFAFTCRPVKTSNTFHLFSNFFCVMGIMIQFRTTKRVKLLSKRYPPLHDNEQTLSALVEVLVDINDAYNVGTRGCPPVKLHLPAGFGTIL